MRRVNCTIPLLEDQMEIFSGYGEKWVKANALVSLRLTPTPRVLIEISDVPITLSGNLYNPGRLSTIRRPCGPKMDVRTLRVQLDETDSSLLMPIRQPVTSIKTGARPTVCQIRHTQFSQLVPARPSCRASGRTLVHRNLATPRPSRGKGGAECGEADTRLPMKDR